MAAEVHYVAGYLKQAGEELSGVAGAYIEAECGAIDWRVVDTPTITLGKPTGSFR